ncbi:MAG: hypothetical protein WCX65_13155 [bacterium]
MEFIVTAALWSRIALSAAAFFSAVFIRGESAARSAIRALLLFFVAVNAIILALYFAYGPNFPLNHKYDGFFFGTFTLSLIVLLYMKSLKSRAPLAIAASILLVFSAAGIYGAKVEAVMRLTNMIPAALLFVIFRDVSLMFFAFSAAVSAVELFRPGKTFTPTGRMSDAMYSPVLWGFIAFCFCQLFGSLWALSSSYGDVWLWKQSFLFSAVVWIYYGGMLHARYIPKWPEKLFPALAVFGFFMQIFYLYYYSAYFEIR